MNDKEEVVITWRGFRCFTRRVAFQRFRRISRRVVIPWRGFRCFTPADGGASGAGGAAGLYSPGGDLGVSHIGVTERDTVSGRVLVVIPWRGFRCFTLRAGALVSLMLWFPL